MGGASAYVDMQTGKGTIVVPDISDEQMGVQISHIINGGEENLSCGNGARLNLHETLIKEENGYIYTDGMGEKHTVTESFYYIDENGEKQVITDKSLIVIEPNGMMSYSNGSYNVFREEKTDNGLKVTTTLDGISNIENYEQRVDEQKQLEEQIKAYENAILEYAIVDTAGNIRAGSETLDGIIMCVKNLSYQLFCVSKSDAYHLNALEIQRLSMLRQNGLNTEILDLYEDQTNDIDNQISIVQQQEALIQQSTAYNKEQFKYLLEAIIEPDELTDINKTQICNYAIIDTDGNIEYYVYRVADEFFFLDKRDNVCFDSVTKFNCEDILNILLGEDKSKLYKEYEIDENGKVTGEFDQSGINKIVYKDNSAIHPNGSIHSCGVSAHDGNSAITMSTENGEENSIQKLYTNGYLTRVISGDNVYDYTYDYKGRVTNVKINGEDYVNYTYEYNETMQAERVIATYSDGTVITDSKDPMYSDISISDGTISNYISKTYDKEKITEITLLGSNGPENKTAFEYNQHGQVTTAARSVFNFDTSEFNENYREEYSYDENGNIIQRLINFNNPRGDITTYQYNNDTKKLESMLYANGLIKTEPKTDCLGRNRGKDISLLNNKIYSEDITYLKQGDHATVLPLTISYGKNTDNGFAIKENIKYKYDNMGNITKVYENGDLVTEYKYDATNRLARENNKALGKTYVFLYDNKGNILSKKEYPFTLKCDEYLEELDSINTEYTYSNNKLISFSNEKIEYNAVGSPIIYRNNELVWRFGKRLTNYGANTFDYNAEGKRISKNDIQYVYDIEGKLYEQYNGADNIVYFYDNNSSIVGFSYNSMMCLYKKDLLGNIIEILDTSGNTMVKYTYDAWGNHTITDYTEFGLGNINPIRYRGYYYDVETDLYYLKSRYYDPQTGRFISMDDISYLDPESINGLNLYAYCGNNPVMRVDPSGNAWWHCLLAIGAVIVVAAATVLTCGAAGIAIGGAGLAGAVIHGAAVGALIGAGIGAVGGAVAGGIYSAVTGADFWTSVVIGAAAGFGIGAIIGAIVGGTIGYTSFAQPGVAFNPKYHSNLPQNGVNPQTVQYGRQRFETKKVIRNLFETIRNGKIEKAITVSREGIVLQGNHRLLIARLFKITIDVIIGGMSQ